MSFKIEQGLFKYNIKDHYAILGVPLDADEQMIRQQYLKIARLLHPDTCKFKEESDKRLANQIFSQFISLSHKQLSNEALRIEFLLVLSQTGKRIAEDPSVVTIASETSKRLFKATKSNLNAEYNKIITTLSEVQYTNIQEALNKIAEISEVNLVYLMQKQGQDINWKPKNTGAVQGKTEGKTEQPIPVPSENLSPSAVYLKRAEEYIEQNLPAQAIIELRDVLKVKPNDSAAHALMGLAYLEQNQITMAKVHINKAIQSNAQDPLTIKAKKALVQATKENDANKGLADKKSSLNGIFKNIFGGKKE